MRTNAFADVTCEVWSAQRTLRYCTHLDHLKRHVLGVPNDLGSDLDQSRRTSGFPRLYAGANSCSGRHSTLCSLHVIQRRLTKPFYWREFDLCSKAPAIRTRSVLSPIHRR